MRRTKGCHPRLDPPAGSGTGGFTLLEMLVSVAVLAAMMVAVAALMNATSSSYRMISGKMDIFESARTGFETLSRTIRQATIQSYLGYDDPKVPTRYALKSDLHFISGPRDALGLANAAGTYSPHALFFQAPLGVADGAALQTANGLLCSTGFFLDYGDEPGRPPPVDNKTPHRYRYRLFQFIQPRESMDVYNRTLTSTTSDGQTFPLSNDSYDGTDWFSAAKTGGFCHVLAENVVALAILPVFNGSPAPSYLWNSRDPAAAGSYSHHRLPQSLKVAMAVIDETSAKKLDQGTTPPVLFPATLFSNVADYDQNIADLKRILSQHQPPLTFRIFSAEIPISTSDWNL